MTFFNNNYKYKRKSSGYIDAKGNYVEGSFFEYDFVGNIQIMSGKDMQLLPEGRRETESIKIFSGIRLNTVDVKNKTNPDIVIFNGEEYEVISSSPYQNNLINHYEMIAQKK